MPLIKLNKNFIKTGSQYLSKVLKSGNFGSLVYRMDDAILAKRNNVTTLRRGITPRAVEITFPDVKKPEYTLVYLLFTFTPNKMRWYDKDGDIAILACPSGNVKDLDGNNIVTYTSAKQLQDELYPYIDSPNPVIKARPARILDEVRAVAKNAQGLLKVQDIINGVVQNPNPGTPIATTIRRPSRSYLSEAFFKKGLPHPTIDQLDQVFGTS